MTKELLPYGAFSSPFVSCLQSPISGHQRTQDKLFPFHDPHTSFQGEPGLKSLCRAIAANGATTGATTSDGLLVALVMLPGLVGAEHATPALPVDGTLTPPAGPGPGP